MKQQRLLVPVLILFGLVFLSPAPARADNTVSMIEELLDAVHDIDSSIPSGSTLDPVLQCLQNPKGQLDDCANALGGDGSSAYMDSVLDVIQIFEDISKSDYDGVLGVVVKWIGSDAPCIVADILFPGVGGNLCELAKELIEAAVEVGQDIAVFFADVGEGLYDVGKAIYCAFADCSSNPPPPQPPQQAVYDQCFSPQLGNGLYALKTKGESGLSALIQSLTSTCWQRAAAALLKSNYSSPNSVQNDTGALLNQVAGQFSTQVHANWAADMPKTVIPELLARRAGIQDQDMFNMLLKGAGDMANNWAGSYYTTGIDVNNITLKDWSRYSAMIQDACNAAFSPYAQVDTWIKEYPDQAKQIVEYGQPGLMTNAQWCALQVNDDQMKFKAFANGYKPPTCPVSGNIGSASYKFRCAKMTDYGVCRIVKSLWPPDQDQCGFNVPMVGQQVAGNSTVNNCTVKVVDNSPTTDTPVQVNCNLPAQTAAAQAKYRSHYNLTVTLVSFQTVPDPQYEALIARVNAIVWLVGHGQDPHGNLSCPPACSYTPGQTTVVPASEVDASKKRLGITTDQGTVKLKDSKTATTYTNNADKMTMVSNDTATGKARDPNANRTTEVSNVALPMACENRIQVADFDPLIVLAEMCVFTKLRSDPNQDFGFKDKNQKPLKWYYLDGVMGNMNALKADEHPSDSSSVNSPVLVDWWANTDSENRFSKPK
jgi:hypothetical protein